MSAVSETIVREFFELHGFFLRQHRKYISPSRREDDEIDFFVMNPRFAGESVEFPFVLASENMDAISRAIVVVKGWHTETFSPAVLANAPEIFRFVQPTAFKQAAKVFGVEGDIARLLVVPALPVGADAKAESIKLLKSKGIDGVIPFHTMLSDLIGHIEVNRNYQKSDLLQVIRILKNYDFLKGPQMELFGGGGTSRRRKSRKKAE